MSEKENYITLKWGTLKSWNFAGNQPAQDLMKKYLAQGVCYSAMTRKDTKEQKELICQMIDLMPGEILLEWDDKSVSHEEAKKYIREYRKEAE